MRIIMSEISIRKEVLDVQLLSLTTRWDQTQISEYSDSPEMIMESELLQAQIAAIANELNRIKEL